MNNLKYFLQFIFIIFLLLIYKILGLKISTKISGCILTFIGPLFRSNKIVISNLSKAFPKLNLNEKKIILKKMWFNYGRILAEYTFIDSFRKKADMFSDDIIIENQNILEKIKNNSKPVIFVSGHFNNFELMAMHIEKSGIDLAAVYRPLNNKFLNPVMERIRKKYICRNQIKKGIAGTKELLKNFKAGNSIALMIDQRVSEGVMCEFFGQKAKTTTIPAQFVKKFDANIVPIYIERIGSNNFRLKIYEILKFKDNETIFSITLKLNKILEEMIIKNPTQWIWTHNRWK
jgi:Kdo2-lipid IVA lauroyltransferase/acyltransferase